MTRDLYYLQRDLYSRKRDVLQELVAMCCCSVLNGSGIPQVLQCVAVCCSVLWKEMYYKRFMLYRNRPKELYEIKEIYIIGNEMYYKGSFVIWKATMRIVWNQRDLYYMKRDVLQEIYVISKATMRTVWNENSRRRQQNERGVWWKEILLHAKRCTFFE